MYYKGSKFEWHLEHLCGLTKSRSERPKVANFHGS